MQDEDIAIFSSLKDIFRIIYEKAFLINFRSDNVLK